MIINETISGRIECRNKTYELSNNNVISASGKRLACKEGAFEIGGMYAATITLTCRLKGASSFAVRGAKMVIFSQYDNEDAPYCIGTFWAVNVRRTGDIFTIDGQDAVGWTDVSSYNDIAQNGIQSLGTYLRNYEQYYVSTNPNGDRPIVMEWFRDLTGLCNQFLAAQTGISNMLSWQNYDSENNIYFGNEHLWRDDGDGWHPKSMFRPSVYLENGGADSDCPRDFFSYLAELTGGFVCTDPETGSLTLGQFGMIKPGTAEIGMKEIEKDSCEIADYTISLYFVYAYGETKTGRWASGWTYTTSPDYENHVYIHWDLESNPFVDGYAAAYVIDSSSNDKMTSVSRGIWEAFYHRNTIANGVPGIEELREKSKFTVRPFRCRVHAQKRFELGQQIRINYQDIADSSAVRVYNSIITSIQWTFQGGHTIACGGEDSRVMADCLRASKGDKALKETRNRCAALERKIADLS